MTAHIERLVRCNELAQAAERHFQVRHFLAATDQSFAPVVHSPRSLAAALRLPRLRAHRIVAPSNFCAVSSVVEHLPDTEGVTGSNPVSRTIAQAFRAEMNCRDHAARAPAGQLDRRQVERDRFAHISRFASVVRPLGPFPRAGKERAASPLSLCNSIALPANSAIWSALSSIISLPVASSDLRNTRFVPLHRELSPDRPAQIRTRHTS